MQTAEPTGQTLAERLTAQFYAWERRGRGWEKWVYLVPLEPEFEPFFGHFVAPDSIPDDGRMPSWFETLLEKLTGKHAPHESAPIEEEYRVEPEMLGLDFDDPLVEFQIAPTPDRINPAISERFLRALASCKGPLSFEIVGLPNAVEFRLVSRTSDKVQVRNQVEAYFPESSLRPAIPLVERFRSAGQGKPVVVEFGLAREFMLPLAGAGGLDPDPLIAILGAFGSLETGDIGCLQILFEPVRSSWSESIMRAVTDREGGPFFMDFPELVALARKKVASPLYGVVIRTAARSGDTDRAWEIVRGLSGALAQFGSPQGNALIPLADDEAEEPAFDLLLRQTCRSGMILGSEELVPLVHLPSASLRSAKLAREERKTKAAPAEISAVGLVIGENTHRGTTRPVALSSETLMRHTHLVGATGTGKSTLLLNLAVQAIEQGHGIGVIDPHGDLVEDLLGGIPEKRIWDVVLFDPSDEEFLVGCNILSAHSARERDLLSSDLVAVFRRLSTSWGDQMNAVLGNAIQAILESPEGGTLLDLRRFLVDRSFRDTYLRRVRDREAVFYWQHEFPLLSGKPQGPILTRLDAFLRPRLVRNVVAERENRLDFRRIMDEGKIVLIRLAQGAIGEENAALLGSILVSKIQQAAMSRSEIPAESRRDFILIIDEFHNFVTPSLTALLSAGRKFRVGLVLAHQELRQLQAEDARALSAVLGNAATRIVFRVGDADAKALESGFSSFTARDLMNLGVGEAVCRIERSDHDFSLRTRQLPRIAADATGRRREEVIASSRAMYARKATPEEASAGERPEVMEVPELLKRPAMEQVVSLPSPDLRTLPLPKPKRPPVEAQTPGRGGAEHKYLQELVKRWGEERGYRATVEKETPGGGRVDVALEREGFSLACEISVTSTPDYEIGNIGKCLAAGFERIVVLSREKKILAKIREKAASLQPESLACVLFLTPEELFASLDLLPPASGAERTVRGYKVRVGYRPVAGEDKASRLRAVSEVIATSLRKLKRGG